MDRRQFLKTSVAAGVGGITALFSYPATLFSYTSGFNAYDQPLPAQVQQAQDFSQEFMKKLSGLDGATLDALFEFDEGDCQCYNIKKVGDDKTMEVFLKAKYEGEGGLKSLEPNQPLYLINSYPDGKVEVLVDSKLEGRVDRYYKPKLDKGADLVQTTYVISNRK